MVVLLLSILLRGKWPLTPREATHLVVFEKANKHCKPAATVRKPNRKLPRGNSMPSHTAGIHPSYSFTLQECSQKHAAQLPHPVSTLRVLVPTLSGSWSPRGHKRSCVAALSQFRPGHPLYQISACGQALHSAFQTHSGSASYLVFVPVIKNILLTKQCIWKVSALCMVWHLTHWNQ